MNTRQMAWWRMVFQMVALLRQWQLEKSHDPYWAPSPTERKMFDYVSDFWAEVMLQSRASQGGPRDRKQREYKPKVGLRYGLY